MLALVLDHPVQLPVVALTLLAGSVMPVLTSLVTNACSSAGVKSVVNAALAAVAGGVTAALATKGHVVPSDLLLGIATAFIGSISSYHGLLNPAGIIDAINRNVPGGIGQSLVQTAAQAVDQYAPPAVQNVFAATMAGVPEGHAVVSVPPGSSLTITHRPAPPVAAAPPSVPAPGGTVAPRPGV